jgi:hypothetical protein
LAQIFFFTSSKSNNFQYCDICAYKKKEGQQSFFSPPSFVAVFGSGMDKNLDPGSGISIPDPEHWKVNFRMTCTIYVVCSNLTGQLSRIQGDLDRSTRTEREALQQVNQLFTTTSHHVQYVKAPIFDSNS